MVSVPGELPGLTTPAALRTLPVIVEFPFSVPPLRLNPAAPTWMFPVFRMVVPPVCVKPALKFSVPTLALTVPVLLNATPTVLLIPPVIWKMPELLNVPVVPPLRTMPFPKVALPFRRVQVAPARLLITAPFCTNRVLPAVGLANVVVPETLSVRASRKACEGLKLIPPLAFVTPVPLIVPPVHVRGPLTVTVLIPVRVPEERVSAEVVTVPPAMLKLAVPPLTVRAPVVVDVPEKIAVPPLTVVAPGTL